MNHLIRTSEHAGGSPLLRPLLFTIASIEILGSATEADADVLRDSYLRWATVDLDLSVRETKAYLAQLVTRQALNTLRAEALSPQRVRQTVAARPLLLDESDPTPPTWCSPIRCRWR